MRQNILQNDWSNLRINTLFGLIVCANVALLIFACYDLSIYHKEAYGVLYSHHIAFKLSRISMDLFGSNDYFLRAPFICLHICNMCLMFAISKMFLSKRRDSLVVVLVYAILPGVIFSSLFVIKSGLIIFIALLCCFLELKRKKMPYLVMAVSVFIDGSFAILFFACFFYALRIKNTQAMMISLIFFALNMHLFGLDISGVPRNYFISNLGTMALYFSPLLLIYYIYTLYNAITKQKCLLVDIGATSIFFVILLSFRQNVDLESLFPMSVVALPVALRQFFFDMRIRLKPFRKVYVRRFVVVFVLLVAQSFVLYANKILYIFGFDISNHFAYRHYIGKDVANALKARNINAIKTPDNKLQVVLKFYGISDNSQMLLIPLNDTQGNVTDKIEIVYLGRKVATFGIIKP